MDSHHLPRKSPRRIDDPHHLETAQFLADNPYGIPALLKQTRHISEQNPLVAYTDRSDGQESSTHAIAHFFLDDRRFETLWTYPQHAIPKLARFHAVLTPDFSMYPGWPQACSLWNHYRKQWLGRFWQAHRIHVIATVNWADEETFPFCFLGIPKRQSVALSVPDIRDPETHRRFMHGFNAMLQHLNPRQILVYGRLPVAPPANIQVINYLPDWNKIKPRIKAKNGKKLTLPPHRKPLAWIETLF